MLDLRKARASIGIELKGMQPDRAMQCPSLDPKTGQFYTSQARKRGRHEDTFIYRHQSDGTLVGLMKLVLGGHGTTISFLEVRGQPGVVMNWSGHGLVWVPWLAGEWVWEVNQKAPIRNGNGQTIPSIRAKGASPIFRSVAAGNCTVHIDHEHQTISVRKKTGLLHTFRLFPLDNPQPANQIGRTVGPMRGNESRLMPYQGQFVLGRQLFLMYGYGAAHQTQRVRAYDYDTGKQLYSANARVLGSVWHHQEPESGLVIGGVPFLGLAARRHESGNRRRQLLVELNVPAPVKYLGPYVVDPEKVVTFLNGRDAKGKSIRQRKPGFKITTGVRVDGDVLVTRAGVRYALKYLKKVA